MVYVLAIRLIRRKLRKKQGVKDAIKKELERYRQIVMKNILEYKGYHAKIIYDSDARSLRGMIEGIHDYVDFEAEDVASVEQEFHSSVDDYLAFCEEVGKVPEREYVNAV